MGTVLASILLLTAVVLVLSGTIMGVRSVLAPERPVKITVNGTLEIDGRTGAKLLTILKDADLAIPSACAGAGTCGLCRVSVPGNGGEPLPTEAARLSRAELRKGMRLACQLVVRGPLEVSVPDAFLSAETWDFSVKSTKMLAPLIREIVLVPPRGALYVPRPGGFVQVTAPPYSLDLSDLEISEEFAPKWAQQGWRTLSVQSSDPVARAYSLANRPADRGAVLNIRLAIPPPQAPDAPPGVVSSYLFNLKEKDTVQLSGPFGDFTIRDPEQEMVFIGGGVGMAPLRALIHHQLDRASDAKISFWYGARSVSDTIYQAEFDNLAASHGNFDFTLALSDPAPEDNWTGERGFIHEIAFRNFLSGHSSPESCHYYLCGPPLMVRAVLAMLDNLGVDPDAIYFDDFGG